MSHKDADQLHQLARLLDTFDDEEQAMLIDLSLRRFKSCSGQPIANPQELSDAGPSREEAPFVRTVYDRFTPSLKSRPSMRAPRT